MSLRGALAIIELLEVIKEVKRCFPFTYIDFKVVLKFVEKNLEAKEMKSEALV